MDNACAPPTSRADVGRRERATSGPGRGDPGGGLVDQQALGVGPVERTGEQVALRQRAALGVLSVVLSWALVNTVYAFKYARLYYLDEPDAEGIDFHQETDPTYSDFASMAFTVGMSYAVSDAEPSSTRIRRVVLGHALLSYAFGTGVMAHQPGDEPGPVTDDRGAAPRVRVGLVADPAAPTEVARRLHGARDADRGDRHVEVTSDPFTTGSEKVTTALDRLTEHGRRQGWDLVVGLTELPLREDGRYLLARTDPRRRTAVLSLPALGGVRARSRARRALASLVDDMLDDASAGEHRVVLPPRTGRWRLLLGMVLANRPWRLVPGLRSALVAALATGAVATINSTVWLLARSLSWWRLVVATVVSLALVVGWIIVDGELWDRPDGDDAAARDRSRLYNASTLLTVGAGALICYAALYLVNLA